MEIKEEKNKISIIISTISTIIMTLFGIAYSLTWGILFIYYKNKKIIELNV